MSGKGRLGIIRQMIINEKRLQVSDLSKKFSVTEETIRRDFEKLEAEGVLNRTYGGAVLNTKNALSGVHFIKRAEHNVEEKKEIAIKALKLLENKSTLYADSSTTVMQTLKLLKDRSDLTVVTNSSEAFHELLLSDLTMISTGGIFNKKSLSFQGDLTEKATQNYNVDVALVSCKALNKDKAACDSNEAEARIKKIMIEQAEEVILLIDGSKFGSIAFVHLADFENINYIVTDKKPSDEWIDILESSGVKLIY